MYTFCMIKAILFDADGVLLNGEKFSRVLAKEKGLTEETTHEFFKGPFKDTIVGKKDLRDILPPFLAKWNWQGGVDAFLQYWFESEHKIDEALIGYIQELRAKNIMCYVATNQEKNRIEYMLKNMGFADAFDGVFASSHIGHKKPTVQFYEMVVASLKLKKDQIMFWDDTEKNVDVAKHFGIHAELYTDFENFVTKMQSDYKL